MALCLFFAVACDYAKDAEDITHDDGDESQVSGISSIAYVKSLYRGEPYTIVDDLMINGVVVANDRYGNFYKTLVVEDASAGIELRIDQENLFKTFFIGDSLSVYCNNLTLGAYGGTVQIGSTPADGYECSPIPTSDLSRCVSKGGHTPQAPVPVELTLSELSARWLSCYVKIIDVQFADNGIGFKWCDSDLSTDRILVDKNGNNLIVRTSPYAVFAGNYLPKGSGFICGILSTFAGSYQLRVIDDEQADFSSPRF